MNWVQTVGIFHFDMILTQDNIIRSEHVQYYLQI